jgi:hypothetical protein
MPACLRLTSIDKFLPLTKCSSRKGDNLDVIDNEAPRLEFSLGSNGNLGVAASGAWEDYKTFTLKVIEIAKSEWKSCFKRGCDYARLTKRQRTLE